MFKVTIGYPENPEYHNDTLNIREDWATDSECSNLVEYIQTFESALAEFVIVSVDQYDDADSAALMDYENAKAEYDNKRMDAVKDILSRKGPRYDKDTKARMILHTLDSLTAPTV